MMRKNTMKLAETAVSMLAVTTALWMMSCQGSNEGSSTTAIEAQALQACLADQTCKNCYDQCLDENADEGTCRDGCCRFAGGERVRAYCHEHDIACREEGRSESCEACEMRCPDADWGDGGVDMRDHGDGDRGEMAEGDCDRGEWGSRADAGAEDCGEPFGRPDMEGDSPDGE